MAKLAWDETGNRLYETGVKKVVLYPQSNGAYPQGYAWSGVTNVSEKPTGAEATALYADDIKYLNLISNEDLEASIEAYMYPDEFAQCDGSVDMVTGMSIGQQKRKAFGLSYQTTLGNDEDGNDHAYKIHLIYGCLAAPSEKAYATINDSPEAITFSWEIKTTPVVVGDGSTYKPTALITIDSSKFTTSDQKAKLKALEDKLYGTTDAEPMLPLPDAVYAILSGTSSNSSSSGTEG